MTSISTAPSRRFWDRHAPRYFAQPIPDEDIYARKLAVTRQFMARDMSVLEIGCGTGGTATAHAPYVAHVEAMDVSPRMIAIGEQQAREAGVDNLLFRSGTLDTLPSWPEGHDMVLALNVLHLLPDWKKAIGQIRDRLGPGAISCRRRPALATSIPSFAAR